MDILHLLPSREIIVLHFRRHESVHTVGGSSTDVGSKVATECGDLRLDKVEGPLVDTNVMKHNMKTSVFSRLRHKKRTHHRPAREIKRFFTHTGD